MFPKGKAFVSLTHRGVGKEPQCPAERQDLGQGSLATSVYQLGGLSPTSGCFCLRQSHSVSQASLVILMSLLCQRPQGWPI